MVLSLLKNPKPTAKRALSSKKTIPYKRDRNAVCGVTEKDHLLQNNPPCCERRVLSNVAQPCNEVLLLVSNSTAV